MEIPSFNALIQQSIIDHWDQDALTDYKGATLQYHDVARKIEKLHIMFENSGVVKGDKIALCGRNSANWAVAFLATLTYGAIAVPILHEFMPDQIHNIVNHSDAKLLFVGDVVATQVDATKIPGLEGIIYIPDYSLVVSRTDKLTYAREHLNEMFGIKYPKYFRNNHVNRFLEGCDGSIPCSVGQCRLCRECIGQEDQGWRFSHQHPADGSHVWYGIRVYLRVHQGLPHLLSHPHP